MLVVYILKFLNTDDSQNVVHPIYDITLRNSHEEEESIFVKVPFESVVGMLD